MLHFVRRLVANPRLWQIALAIYTLALFISTHVPKDTPLVPGRGMDGIVHFAAFTLLAWLLAVTWQLSSGWLTGTHLLVAWVAVVFYAAFDEISQPLFGRQASFTDWLADATGALVGLVLFVVVRRYVERNFAIDWRSR